MKRNEKLERIIKSLGPLIVVLVGSITAYALVFRDKTMLEIISSDMVLKTLVPGFFLLYPSVLKIKCKTTQVLIHFLLPICIFFVLLQLSRGTSLPMNILYTAMYILLGSFTGYYALADDD